MKRKRYPAGWNQRRVEQVLDHYEVQTEEQAVAEDEAAFAEEGNIVMAVPSELVPIVRDLIKAHRRERGKRERSTPRRSS